MIYPFILMFGNVLFVENFILLQFNLRIKICRYPLFTVCKFCHHNLFYSVTQLFSPLSLNCSTKL